MPKGRNKGFQYYMCKKFFHPSNPQNLERVFIARQRKEEKDKKELEKNEEYKKEQERWNSKYLLGKPEERKKLELSFMYDAPTIHKDRKNEKEKDGKDGTYEIGLAKAYCPVAIP